MRTLAILIATGCTLLGATAQSADYPTRPIRLIVPYAAGGASDIPARILAKKMSESLGQNILIENIAGAAGTIGAGNVARAEPDGYTLLFGYATQFTIAPPLYPNLNYDPVKSFAPIGSVMRFHFLMTAHSSVPVNTLPELVTYAKANPGKVTFASPGVGTSTHLIGELFKLTQGIDIVHVPYRGGGPAITDLVAGRIHIYWDAPAGLLAWVEKGNIKPLAVTSAQRLPNLPSVPTVLEVGMRDLNVFTWVAMFAPAGTPPDITAKLEAELRKAMQDKELQETFTKNGYELFPGDPRSVTDLIGVDLAKWGATVKATGLKIQQ